MKNQKKNSQNFTVYDLIICHSRKPVMSVDNITLAIINSPLLEYKAFINKIANTELLEELEEKMKGMDDCPVTRILLISERLREIYNPQETREDE